MQKNIIKPMKATLDAVTAIASTDPAITAERLKAALADLCGESVCSVLKEEPLARAYTAEQVAAALGISKRQVTRIASNGWLKGVYTGARGLRARCYTGESVKALLEGRKKEARG